MQSKITSCCQLTRSTASRPILPARCAAPRLGRSRLVVANVFGGSGVDSVNIASQLVSTLTVTAVGIWLLRKELMLEQDRLHTSSEEPCPSCGGSGYEPCACTRWSDGDVGCSTCRKTGYMRCRSCGGGGTAVPIKVSIRKTDGIR